MFLNQPLNFQIHRKTGQILRLPVFPFPAKRKVLLIDILRIEILVLVTSHMAWTYPVILIAKLETFLRIRIVLRATAIERVA